MSGLSTKVRTAWKIGPANVARVLLYRLALRLGIHPAQYLSAAITGGPFYDPICAAMRAATPVSAWETHALLFGHHKIPIGIEPPDWFTDLIRDVRHPSTSRPWWSIPDFGATGDIKAVWEMSRMDWVIPFAQRVYRRRAHIAIDKYHSLSRTTERKRKRKSGRRFAFARPRTGDRY